MICRRVINNLHTSTKNANSCWVQLILTRFPSRGSAWELESWTISVVSQSNCPMFIKPHGKSVSSDTCTHSASNRLRRRTFLWHTFVCAANMFQILEIVQSRKTNTYNNLACQREIDEETVIWPIFFIRLQLQGSWGGLELFCDLQIGN